MTDTETIARLTGAMPSEVRRELYRAIVRSEPDAREVYGLIRGRRFVAKKRPGDWDLALERRTAPWERAGGTGWSG